MRDDADLLRRYADDHSETAFTELVERHVDFVYSAAMRLLNGDSHRAEDVTQQVFTELARQAARLKKHPALVGWLYTTIRLMALRMIRTEQRRRVREQEAYVMNELLEQSASPADWEKLRPVLDEAMHELGDTDRLALLLRFFKNKSLKEVGAALGLNDNAARMRVERAVDKLRVQLARRGITSTAAVLASALAHNAVAAAPPAFAATLATSSLAGAAATGTTLTVVKFMTASKLKIALVGALVAASIMTPVVIDQQARARLRLQNETLQAGAEQLAALRAENEQLANVSAPVQTPPGDHGRLLRLRAEIAALQNNIQELSQPATNEPVRRDAMLASMRQLYSDRVKRVKQSFERNPAEQIPELQFLSDADWLEIVMFEHGDAADERLRAAMSSARGRGNIRFANRISTALRQYSKTHNDQFPPDVSELKPYFEPPISDDLLQRWTVVAASQVPDQIRAREDWVITQKAPIDPDRDQRFYVGLRTSISGVGPNQWAPAAQSP